MGSAAYKWGNRVYSTFLNDANFPCFTNTALAILKEGKRLEHLATCTPETFIWLFTSALTSGPRTGHHITS
jgi:hypothetical protein